MNPIYVTRPSLPPLEEFTACLEEIWDSRVLTNDGKFVKTFEADLTRFLGVTHGSVFCNGTIALQTALQGLRVTGEVITTPFTFPATVHSLHWNGCTPVFCDVDPSDLNLDPKRVESLITPKTTAILPVHVFGIPCQVDLFRNLADQHGLRLIYDGAHAFGVKVGNRSIYDYGDVSMASFHATKVFNTFEGGAIFTSDPALKKRVDFLRNFGILNETEILGPGSNGKMNELQAACGSLLLKYFEQDIRKRMVVRDRYFDHLKGKDGFSLAIATESQNASYFPILIQDGKRDAVYHGLRDINVFSRRYFFPLVSDIPIYRSMPGVEAKNISNARTVSEQVLCLPIYPDLSLEDVDRISEKVLAILT